MKKRTRPLNRAGFTIIELMIATAVLSIILLLVTVMITRIGDLYYKGITQSRLQEDARSITTDVTQDLELSSGALEKPPTPSCFYDPDVTTTDPACPLDSEVPVRAYCINGVRYSYIVGEQIGVDIAHVLWRDSPGGSAPCRPLNITLQNPGGTDGSELIAPDSQLTEFRIKPISTSPAFYSISVYVAYGASNLLSGTGVNTACMGGTGNQFCATAGLTTTAAQRIN